MIVAARHGHMDCVSDLMAAGARIEAVNKGDAHFLSYEACAKADAAANDGTMPLSLAHRGSHIGVVIVLQGQAQARWRWRRALALIWEQREAGSDWKKARKGGR